MIFKKEYTAIFPIGFKKYFKFKQLNSFIDFF